MRPTNATLVLALGNEVAGDDAVGLHAARRLRERCVDGVDVIETGEAGLALLDFIQGYRRLLILDSVCGCSSAVGTIHSFGMADLRPVGSPSPHYAGLPELKRIAEASGLSFPEDVRAIAMGIAQPDRIIEGLSPEARAALPEMVDRAAAVLHEWGHVSVIPPTPIERRAA